MNEEQRAWVYGLVAAVVPVVYFAVVLSRVPDTPVSEIDYVWPLLIAIGAGIVLNALLAPQPKKKDERDKEVGRVGGRVAFIVMSALTVIPLALAMLRVDQFWIANTLYLAFVLSAVTESLVRIVAYRRGF
ncbi:hypothetical protein [Nocardioides gilvus]|uniref:hypothetical protein n=1 Tax=Nocardioides gilvus TaxID=1735589 RepID=UPI000D7417AC|nr:hypothetical protein [Nocardioides gilvus]